MTPRAIKNAVIVRQDRASDKVGNLFVPQGKETHTPTGTVVAVGPTAWEGQDGVAVGARVIFKRQPNSALDPGQRGIGLTVQALEDLLSLEDTDILAEIES
jgi:co-chaperonin GroES (HSP10)